MAQPGIGEGGEISVVAENIIRADLLLKLHQKALIADVHMQWGEEFHPVQLVGADHVVADGGCPQINERVLQGCAAESTTRGIFR